MRRLGGSLLIRRPRRGCDPRRTVWFERVRARQLKAVHDVDGLSRWFPFVPVFGARSDQQVERVPAPGGLDVPRHRQRVIFNPIVVDGVMYRAGVGNAIARGCGRRHRQGDLAHANAGSGGRARDELLGESRSLGSPAAVS